jgi:predicted glycoside hydrolase/deacetylase ChbG (UPF0249 family)
VIIVNADDYGRSRTETDLILACYAHGRITSASAMVFMSDSSRSAELARAAGIDLGLHLNLSQRFAGEATPILRDCHDRVVRFLTSSKYSLLLYNPALRDAFRYVYQAQLDEFVRLYGRFPSHVDGHQHRHLCTNIVLDGIIAPDTAVRRSFSFWPGEKSWFNRTYRSALDRVLKRRYRVTDFFFSLRQCLQANRLQRVFDLSTAATVELMTHPLDAEEYDYLMSDEYQAALKQLEAGTYQSL